MKKNFLLVMLGMLLLSSSVFAFGDDGDDDGFMGDYREIEFALNNYAQNDSLIIDDLRSSCENIVVPESEGISGSGRLTSSQCQYVNERGFWAKAYSYRLVGGEWDVRGYFHMDSIVFPLLEGVTVDGVRDDDWDNDGFSASSGEILFGINNFVGTDALLFDSLKESCMGAEGYRVDGKTMSFKEYYGDVARCRYSDGRVTTTLFKVYPYGSEWAIKYFPSSGAKIPVLEFAPEPKPKPVNDRYVMAKALPLLIK